MYIPSSFKVEDPDKIFDFIRKYNFGLAISEHEGIPIATHLPFMVETMDGEKILTAHFARANPHWKKLREGTSVLAVFQGPHAYITPDWYEQKDTVPTWNYSAVHVTGRADLSQDPDDLRAMVDRLTEHHEQQAQSAWDYEAAHPKREKLLRAIVGLRIRDLKLEAAFKFNQNRSRQDREGVQQALCSSSAAGEKQAGEFMRDHTG